MGQQKTRNVVVILFAVASFTVVIAGVSAALVRAGVESGAVGIGFGLMLSNRTEKLVASPRSRYDRIIVLGDSTVSEYPRGRSVPDSLRKLLRKKASRVIEVISLAIPGMSGLEYYAFADRIAATRPDQVVIPINLASLSVHWRSEFDRVESLGWIPPSRLPDLLTRPFYAWNLTFDRTLMYMGIVGLELSKSWQRYGEEQVRAVHGLHRLRRALLEPNLRTLPDGLPFYRLPFHTEIDNRPNRLHVESIYGEAFAGAEPDHPVVQMLAGALEIYQRAGIHVLAYVVPMNVEHFERIGFDTRTGTQKTIETLRNMVESRGGTFLDLHRFFPDMAFKDLGGHFLQEEGFDGAALLSARLVPELLRDDLGRGQSPTGLTE
jgi:hypothetical protein